jgi:hypothetical protein
MSYSDDDEKQRSAAFYEVQEMFERLSLLDKFRLLVELCDTLPQSEQIHTARVLRHKLVAAVTLEESLYVHLAPLIDKLAAMELQ